MNARFKTIALIGKYKNPDIVAPLSQLQPRPITPGFERTIYRTDCVVYTIAFGIDIARS